MTSSRSLSGIINTSGTTEGGPILAGSPIVLSTDEESAGADEGKVKKKDHRMVLKISPSAHRFDPFDALPVPGVLRSTHYSSNVRFFRRNIKISD